MCQPCYTSWRYTNNRDRLIAVARAANLKSQFGITQDDYDMMYDAQDGLCAICHRACVSGRKLAVDHDHATGRVRGLLCGNCNQALGKANDNPALLREMATYLERSLR
jgi:hypothetical protein